MQAVYVLGSTEKKHHATTHANVLPPLFYQLQEISYLMDFVLTGTLSKKTDALSDFYYRGAELANGGDRQETVKVTRGVDLKDKDYELREGKKHIDPDLHFQEATHTIRDETLRDLFEKPQSLTDPASFEEKTVVPPNELVALTLHDAALGIKESTASKLNLQQMRDLLGLTSKRALQIQKTFGYFKERPQLLARAGYQDLFNLLMFDAGLLPQELKSSSFRQALSKFVKENVEAAKRGHNYKTALFLLQFSRRCADIYREAHSKAPEEYSDKPESVFPEVRQELHALLGAESLSERELYSTHRELVRSYSNEKALSADQLTDLLTSAVYLDRTGIFHPEQIEKERAADIEARDTLRRQRVAIQSLVSGPDGQRLLNRVVQAYYPEAVDQNWKMEQFPYASTEDGSYTIDLMKGELYEQSAPFQPIPSEIMNDPAVAAVFGKGARIIGKEVQPGVYECKDTHGNLFRIRNQPKFQLERKFGEEWYVRMPSSALHFEPRAIYEGKSVWRRPPPDASGYIVDEKSQQPLYQFNVEEDRLSISELDAKAKPTGLIIANLQERPELLKHFNRVEDQSHLVALQDPRTGALTSIELPRYRLKLMIEKERKSGKLQAVVRGREDLEGYALSKTLGLPALSFIDNYLILEKDGRKRIAFPNVPFKPIKGDSLRPKVERQTTENMPAEDLLVFDYNPDTGLLTPLEDTGRLFWQNCISGGMNTS